MPTGLSQQIALARQAFANQVKRLSFTAAEIKAYQNQKLQELLQHAITHSQWHKARLAGIGIDINNISLDTLHTLPPSNKNMVMQNWNEIVTDQSLNLDLVNRHLRAKQNHELINEKYHVWATGGSSGTRGIFVWSLEDYADFIAGSYRFNHFGILEQQNALTTIKRATLVAESDIHMSSYLWTMPLLEKHETHVLKKSDPVSQLVEQLNEIQPHEIYGFPSFIAKLAREATKGNLNISPYAILTCAEPLYPDMRADINAAWPVPLFDFYGSSECGPHGLNCSSSNNLHLCEDAVIIETVDQNNNPVPAGALSAKTLVTSLINKSFPFIRYEIDDRVKVLTEPCPCGSHFQQIETVTGRLFDTFKYKEVEIDPDDFIGVLLAEENISDYQITQTERGVDIAVEVINPIDPTELSKTLTQLLIQRGLKNAEVSVNVVDTLPRHPETGKLKRFTSK